MCHVIMQSSSSWMMCGYVLREFMGDSSACRMGGIQKEDKKKTPEVKKGMIEFG